MTAASARTRLLAWTLALLGGCGFLIVVLLDVLRSGWAGVADAVVQGAPLVVFFVGLGTLLALRRPSNPIGWLLTSGGLTWLSMAACAQYAEDSLTHDRATLSARLAALFTYNAWPLGVLCSVGLPLLLFPNGSFPSRRWRWAAWTMILGCALVLTCGAISTAVVPVMGRAGATATSPLGIPSLSAASDAARALGVLLVAIGALLAVIGIGARFRGARGTERQQLRWVRTGAAIAVAGIISHPIGSQALKLPSVVTDTAVAVALGCLPISITVAVLRYRLYDLDRVVSRTVTYTALTGLLVATYGVLVTGASRLTPSSSSLAVASSTLAVAALFRPLRRRLQRAVDHRFNRSRYHAERTVDDFARRLREQVDLDVVRTDLLVTARQTMQPSSAGLWLRIPGRPA